MMNYKEIAMNEYGIPFPTAVALEGHILSGQQGGNFVDAVLRNDYRLAYLAADSVNRGIMDRIMAFMVEMAPATCWGDENIVGAWQDAGGINGLVARQTPKGMES